MLLQQWLEGLQLFMNYTQVQVGSRVTCHVTVDAALTF